MTQRHQVYKCKICGNIVEVLHEGAGTLVCCGQEMELFVEKMQEEGNEKHLPVVEVDGENVKVVVGSILHPMEEAHHVEWIEVINGDQIYKKYLKPGDTPTAEFQIPNITQLHVREYCNIHGLWGVTI